MKQTVDWHSHWKSETPGFHEGQVNTWLEKYLPQFELPAGTGIFVPLCGKAVDMRWLAEQGFKVIGVELSKVAVESFFREAGLRPEIEQLDRFTIYRTEHITLYQGDFMHLTATQLNDCKLVYDRASIVAIEPFNRAAYRTRMLELIPARTPMLMVLLEYDQQRMQGPPFSVPVEEVEALYQPQYQVDLLGREELIDRPGPWRARGLNSMIESALKLTAAG